MERLFYVPAVKITAKIAETVESGYHIVVDGYTYEKVNKRPPGRSILRKLTSTVSGEQITIYN